ncbi:MAG: ribosome maturation factor RimM [Thermoflexales bacterium]|nr:ribosome maturation factor RimM [Thermoflexales bacterium]MDW8351315.1 ribosome maturation factor RimM [Anaerolineae bacterium]
MAESRPRFLVVGKVSRPHGIAGEIKVQLAPEYEGVLDGVGRIYLNDAEHPYRLLACRPHQGGVLLRLERVTTRNAAEALRGARVLIRTSDLPVLPPGEYYAYQLIGLRVVRESGEVLGELSEVLRTGSNDVYVVKTAMGELLLPAIESVIRSIDLATGTMTVVVPEGLE